MDSSTAYTLGPAPGHQHSHTVIFLHGRDSLATEFSAEIFESEASKEVAPQAASLELPAIFPSVRWVFPSAPILTASRFGTEMSQWFDIWSVENPDERPELQVDGLRQSIHQLWKTVAEEEKLVPRSKIFLAGISQGFATVMSALAVSTTKGYDQPFAGAIGLCSWLPPFAANHIHLAATTPRLTNTPLFLSHAADDDVVPIENGRRLRDEVVTHGVTVSWREYQDGGHWVNEPQGVNDIVIFMKEKM